MKRLFSMVICTMLLVASIFPANAAEPFFAGESVTGNLENGITYCDVITEITNARATEKTYRKTRTLYDGDTVIGVIAVEAAFHYDGMTVLVATKSVVQTDTYEGWSYKQNSLTSSGGTVTLDAKLTKLLIFNVPFTLTITCDKNGNIT